MRVPEAVLETVTGAERVVVMTGAGMSAESGLATFRDPEVGLWDRFRPEELATPEAWAQDRDLVWAWYQWRVGQVLAAEPNAGHRAIAEWARATEMTLVTQNVDDLHERAGSTDVQHLHGSLMAPRCSDCARPAPSEPPPAEPVERLTPPTCEHCGGAVRPGVVWFGEVPHGIDTAADAVVAADLLVVVGTSGVVYPAAGLTDLAVELGRPVLLVDPAAATRDGVTSWRTTAATGLPALVTSAT